MYYRTSSLENKITQKGVRSDDLDCARVINMRDLHHEYKGGCILTENFLATFLGVDLTYLFAFPLPPAAHVGSRYCHVYQ